MIYFRVLLGLMIIISSHHKASLKISKNHAYLISSLITPLFQEVLVSRED